MVKRALPPAPSGAPNAAIWYMLDAFDTSRPRLMGRHAAGEGFLRGFVRHAGVDRIYCHAHSEAEFQEFTARAAAHGATAPTVWVPFERHADLVEPGCLFYPTVGIDQLAYRRRRADQRGYSLVGITHTTVSDGVMAVLAGLPRAPLQEWDALICTSQAVRDTVDRLIAAEVEYLEDRLDATRFTLPQLPVIPLGVDCDAFAGAKAVRAAWRQRLGIRDQDVAVLYFGRLSFHAKANPMPMYRGLEQALAAGALPPGARLHLIQAGWFANEEIERGFRDGAREHCPSVTCHFVDGREAEIRTGIWQAADIFTSLSDNLQETFGLTPIEAMAAGLPCVVSDWNGYRDTVRDGIDGFRVPTLMPPAPYATDLADRYMLLVDDYDHYVGFLSQYIAVDTAAAATAYAALIGNPQRRLQMGAAAAAEARARFDWRVVIPQMQELFAELEERRAQAAEVAPVRDRSIANLAMANPARPDPLQPYAHYASELLHPDSIVTVVPDTDSWQVSMRHSSPLAGFGSALLPDLAELTAITEQLAAAGPMTASALVATLPPDRAFRIFRGLTWMAKVDLVRIAAPARHVGASDVISRKAPGRKAGPATGSERRQPATRRNRARSSRGGDL